MSCELIYDEAIELDRLEHRGRSEDYEQPLPLCSECDEPCAEGDVLCAECHTLARSMAKVDELLAREAR